MYLVYHSLKTKQSKKEDKKDEPSTEANQISMVALTSLSTEFKSAFASLKTKLDAVKATVTDYGERISGLETNANLTAPL